MLENPTDQFESYMEEVVSAVREINEGSRCGYHEAIEMAKVAAINILTDTIKQTFYGGGC